MNRQTRTCAIGAALFGAAMLGSVLPSGAAPISPSAPLLTEGTSSTGVTEVRYRRYYRGRVYRPAPGAAIGLGILGAAAGAAAYGAYGPRYYGPGYAPGYAPGYYGGPYPYRRQYYAPY
ncbi:hypothetical protein ACVIU7_004489 [Bradyrhizobium liaoningense]